MHLGIPEANLSPGREVTLQGAPAQRVASPQSSGNHVLSEGWGRGRARQQKLGAAGEGSILGDSRVCATPGEPRAPPPPRGRVRLARYLRTRLAPPPLPGQVRPPGGSRASCLGEAGLSGLRWRRCPPLQPLTRAEGGTGGGAGRRGGPRTSAPGYAAAWPAGLAAGERLGRLLRSHGTPRLPR